MKNIPTAEELYYQFKGSNVNISKKQFIEAVKYSNSLHVQAALQAAYKNACMKDYEQGDEDICYLTNDMGDSYVLDKNTILNAYPLENIK